MARNLSRMIITIILLSITLVGLVFSGMAQDATYTVNLPIVMQGKIGGTKLTICMGLEPDTLYTYAGNKPAMESVLSAVYDGPMDSRIYAYQPVILIKIPSLADGDAILMPINVVSGDLVVDNSGNPVNLTAGTVVRPSGCRSSDCAITYDGTSPLQMDQMSVTFQLIPNLNWSDGTPLTASDSVYSFNLAADPDTPTSKYTIDRTASYSALDDIVLVWTGLPGFLDSMYYTNFWKPLPEHIWGIYSALELLTADVSTVRPMGWGPYIIDSWTPGVNILLHKNPNYYRAGEGLPNFNLLEFRFVGFDAPGNIAALLSGECDILDQSTGLDSSIPDLLALQDDGLLNAESSPGTVWDHADFDIQHVSYDDGYNFSAGDRVDFFSDVRMRQAIAYCMDRQAVVDQALYGLSEVINSYLPNNHPLYNSAAAVYPYDPTAGMALLDEVGWVDDDGNPDTPRVSSGIGGIPDGIPLTFYYETTDSALRQQVTQILAQSLAGCGIEVALWYHPAYEWYAAGPDGRLYGRKYDLGQFAWLTWVIPPCDLYLSTQVDGPDGGTWIPIMDPAAGPQTFIEDWVGVNTAGYFNPTYDTACNNALGALYGESGYTTNHLLAQQIFAADLPVIPLFLRLKIAASGPTITGYDLDPTAQEMWNIEEFNR